MKTILIFSLTIAVSFSAAAHQVPLNGVTSVIDSLSITRDIHYGTSKTQAKYKQNLLADVYRPATQEKLPILILAHGGYFLGGKRQDMEHECMRLARQGFIVASIDYRLLDVIESEISYKRAVVDAVFDMKAAVRFFRKDAATQNQFLVDTSNIFIGGYSAGAITALHYAYTSSAHDLYEMGGSLMLQYILRCGGKEGRSGNPGFSSRVKGVINISGALFKADLVDPGEPILFSVHGSADDIVPFETGYSGDSEILTEGSGLIHQRANQIGVINRLIEVKGSDHFVYFRKPDCEIELIRFLRENTTSVTNKSR